MEDKDAKAVLESILFISGEPVTLDMLRKTVEIDKYNTERLLRELISDYSLRNTGLIIIEVADGFQMVTNPACSPWVKKLLSTSIPKKLTQSSLETIAIVAYKQPIIKAEIEAIRGVNSDGVVKTLLERRLIKILGRKEVPGRPLMYGTTGEFMQYFGLKDLSELPTLKEFEEVDIPEPPEAAPESSNDPGTPDDEDSQERVQGQEEETVATVNEPDQDIQETSVGKSSEGQETDHGHDLHEEEESEERHNQPAE